MRFLKLNSMAAVIAAAALMACGGGGGGDPGGAPPPVPAPSPGPAPVPPTPPAPAAQPPVNTLRGSAATIDANSTLVFNRDNENLITVADPDSASLSTTLTVDAGTLTLSTGSGGTAEVTVSGTIAQINAALDGMTFIAPAAAQTVVLRIVTRDESTPTPLSDSDEYSITVKAVPQEFRTFQAASMVLGQPDFMSGGSGAPTDRNLSAMRGAVAGNGFGTLYVPDAGHNRVVVFPNGSGTGDPASFALGQPNLFTGGSRVDQGSHPQAAHVAIAQGRMAVAEPSANRVSLYYSVPTSGNAMPESVLGQDNFTDDDAACFSPRLNAPQSVAITPDRSKLLVADTGNHRVMVYHAFPAPNEFAPMGRVLGQSTGSSCMPNRGDPSPHSGTMNQPTGVWTDGTRIVVADTANNRLLVWNSFPGEGASEFERRAHMVLGQADFASVSPNRGATTPGSATLKAPTHVASDGTRLAVADTGNHRVLIWTTFPDQDGTPAQVVLGQSNFARMLPNDSDQTGGTDVPSEKVFSNPGGLHFFRGKLYVTDRDNNRILVFAPQ
jgi:hypothetical protein